MTTQPPERIHGWMNTQLSIARFFGGCSFNGAHYVIAAEEEGTPLVRLDVMQREAKEHQKPKRVKAEQSSVQFSLIDSEDKT